MALYFGYKNPSSSTFDDTELKKDISALKTGLATNNTKTKTLETSLFNKDGSVQMTGDLDLGDNSIVGIHDINPDNSVPSKKYVNDELAKKLSNSGGLMTGQLIMMHNIILTSGSLNMDGNKITNLANPTTNADGSNKKYVDDKTATNANNITSLAGRVTLLEAKKDIYTYHYTYFNLGTNWSYPASSTADGTPYFWMFCKDLKPTSFFHVQTLSYDNDATLESNYTLTFKLDFLNQDGTHTVKKIFTARRGDHVIPGERLMLIDKTFTLSTLTGYQNFVMIRLAVKGNSAKGNEFTISCSLNI